MILNEQQLAAIRRRLAAGENLRGALAAVPGAIFTADVAAVDAQIRRELIGAGPVLAPLLEDGEVTDVVVNGVQVWIDRGAGMERIEDELESEEAARALAVRLAASCGQRLDDASPIVDGTFPSGVRLHAVIPPLSAEGTLISLRTHRARVFTLAELQAGGSVASEVARVVRLLVGQRANVLISGATGAGKTTFLNAMLSLIGAEQRILVIEESAELRPNHPHVIHLQVRKANVQGAGEVTMSDLVRAAMRMRPDRIVLGECRGAEVRDVLGALNTGHEGGWATIHANSTADIPARLVALGALAGMNEATVTA
ncbi:TadA family conjugal transfer-associated ATPase [Trueperella pyogenes]|uniref:TadA family conjugal transfer-associated ATPase n=2 Tax=Trueperella pyogenes TaxID=1661 RepID=A0A3S9QMT5_9ACTO|nr:TadA family conjugal transfer-associated ATPase [Trueperella pyogenes]